MDCLETDLHQLLLSDLVRNVTESIAAGELATELNSSIELITSKVETRNVEEPVQQQARADNTVFMSASQARCNIGFAEIAPNLSEDQMDSAVKVLTDMLRDVHCIEFDTCLSWSDWSLPDQLICETIVALLKICVAHPRFRHVVIGRVLEFVSSVVRELTTVEAIRAISQIAPIFHGLYRAITSTPFPWSLAEWRQLSANIAVLFTSEIPEHFNGLVMAALNSATPNSTRNYFINMFMARYVATGRPLTGYFMICCVVEMQWTVLAQVLSPPKQPVLNDYEPDAAAAANNAWLRITQYAVTPSEHLTQEDKDALDETTRGANQLFSELLNQVEEMDSDESVDTYAWETMAESLKLAAVCSVAVKNLSRPLLSRLKLLLSDKSPVADNFVQEAALTSLTVVLRNFPHLSAEMTPHLRRYVTAPFQRFQFEIISDDRAPLPLTEAAKCLASCIKLSPGGDVLLSNIYSLLNHIAAASHDTNPVYPSSASFTQSTNDDHDTVQSLVSSMQGWDDEQRRLISMSTIYVVSRLALEFRVEEVTRLTIAMLLQRLRVSEPKVEAAICSNLVNLTLAAPQAVAVDVFRAFSLINRTGNQEDPSYSNNTVVASQTRLAQEMHVRPDLYLMYLSELLVLFNEKGVAIQTFATSLKDASVDDMIDQLAALLLPIDALLAHSDFSPASSASNELVALFRNMWFLCVLFGFDAPNEQPYSVNDWQRSALIRIASKTPPIVVENSQDYALSDLEYNSVIRHNYAAAVITKHRSTLQKLLRLRSSDLKRIAPAQVIFLLTIYSIETMRAAKGLPFSLASIFRNAGLNKHHVLGVNLVSLSEKIMADSIEEISRQMADHSLPESLSVELKSLLVTSCHRVSAIRSCASKYLNRLISSFPSLMCDPPLVYGILEVLTLLQRACAGEFTDEYSPEWSFHSERSAITITVPDSFQLRRSLLKELLTNANSWFEMALGRAPLEFQATLQKYLSSHRAVSLPSEAELGASVALKFACTIAPGERKIVNNPQLSTFRADRTKVFVDGLASTEHFIGETNGLQRAKLDNPSLGSGGSEASVLKLALAAAIVGVRNKSSNLKIKDMKMLLYQSAAAIIGMPIRDSDLLHSLIALPFEIFSPQAIAVGIQTWTWLIGEKPDLEFSIMTEIDAAWTASIRHQRGLYSSTLNYDDPFVTTIEYNPTDNQAMHREQQSANRLLTPHTMVLQMLLSRFQAARYDRRGLVFLILRIVLKSALAYGEVSTHALARESRFSFLLFAFETLKSSRMDSYCENRLREAIYSASLSWFAAAPQWSYGASRLQLEVDIKILVEFLSLLQADSLRYSHTLSTFPNYQQQTDVRAYTARIKTLNRFVRCLAENELFRLTVWLNPLHDLRYGNDHVGTVERSMTPESWRHAIAIAWKNDPAVVIHLPERFKTPIVEREVKKCIRKYPREALDVHVAFIHWLNYRNPDPRSPKFSLLWDPVSPIIAITLFQIPPPHDHIVLQYAHRVLTQHPVEVTFFFIPQVVQVLRDDALGYIENFIYQTTRISQLFCHQIIWNMKANCFKGDLAEIEDALKPKLDKMTDFIIAALSGDARAFYLREFRFFDEVTDISGKLRPFIKKSKQEKKDKIDEEMAKINVDVGVYLPSNPDGVVVDIDKRSGRPLQSHAKAPFMATFKVRKETTVVSTDPDSVLGDSGEGQMTSQEQDVWQAAIFKVGDDCRQDVLALQVIAMFKNIFMSVGLPLYLYPYRVTATAPGCGVIDVVPNSTSRDEMGRAKVNDLTTFFLGKYGGEDTVEFQKARMNFIQSMAAYSLACYILQIKDRHNGNIMIDGEGHIVHIDFGFLFDIDEALIGKIRPGGVKFEPHSFKLTHEMVMLMGGRESQGYSIFRNLTVKGFLAIRPYTNEIIDTIKLMLGTDLPSFKGEGTIRRIHERFAPRANERQAAEWMVSIIDDAHENVRSTVYDEFQRIQNGIPYA